MSDTHETAVVPAPRAEVQRMHPLVNAAMQQGGLDPTTLRELLAVQRDWEAGEARKAYTRALAALKHDLPTVIERDRLVDYTSKSGHRTRYTHTSLAAVMDAVTEPLTRHGFSLSWTPATHDRSVSVTCRLTHTEGHSEEATLHAPADVSGNKNPAQAIASTVTLLSRYTALSLLGIATADMPEPTGRKEASRDAVDVSRNMAAVRAIEKAGLGAAAAEAHVGKPVAEWTGHELGQLRTWLDEHKRSSARSTP